MLNQLCMSLLNSADIYLAASRLVNTVSLVIFQMRYMWLRLCEELVSWCKVFTTSYSGSLFANSLKKKKTPQEEKTPASLRVPNKDPDYEVEVFIGKYFLKVK